MVGPPPSANLAYQIVHTDIAPSFEGQEISLVGHSLGGYYAQYVVNRTMWFNIDDPGPDLSLSAVTLGAMGLPPNLATPPGEANVVNFYTPSDPATTGSQLLGFNFLGRNIAFDVGPNAETAVAMGSLVVNGLNSTLSEFPNAPLAVHTANALGPNFARFGLGLLSAHDYELYLSGLNGWASSAGTSNASALADFLGQGPPSTLSGLVQGISTEAAFRAVLGLSQLKGFRRWHHNVQPIGRGGDRSRSRRTRANQYRRTELLSCRRV